MFKIEGLVDDKRLAEVLHLLAGRVYNVSAVPIHNAEKTANGQVKAKHGSITEVVLDHIKQHKLKQFTTSDIGDALIAAGWKSRSAANYALDTLRKRGLLKKSKRRVAGRNGSKTVQWELTCG